MVAIFQFGVYYRIINIKCMLINSYLIFFYYQLLDVFGHKSNISLVFDFMETDLEVL